MNFLKDLSTRYLKIAKKLGYTWRQLLKKETREKVIDKVIIHKMNESINKTKKDSIKQTIRDLRLQKMEDEIREFHLKQMEDEVKREHVKIMKQQKTKTEIVPTAKALKGNVESFTINIINNKDPLIQLQNTRKAIKHRIISTLKSKRGLKFIETLKVTFTKISNGEKIYKTAYFNSKAQTIINDTEIPETLKLSKDQILNIIAKWISEGSGWTVESVDNHFLNIVQYTPLKGSS